MHLYTSFSAHWRTNELKHGNVCFAFGSADANEKRPGNDNKLLYTRKRLETNMIRTGKVIQAIAFRIIQLWLSGAKAQHAHRWHGNCCARTARVFNCAARASSYAIERGARAGFAFAGQGCSSCMLFVTIEKYSCLSMHEQSLYTVTAACRLYSYCRATCDIKRPRGASENSDSYTASTCLSSSRGLVHYYEYARESIEFMFALGIYINL